MNKIKKIISSFSITMISFISKVYATVAPTPFYGVYETKEYDSGIILLLKVIGKIIVPIVLFISGIVVIFSKKLSKKSKIILVAILVIIGIIMFCSIKFYRYI